MSLSVTGSSNNPFANLQYLLQQDSSQSGAMDQSNPLSALLAELSPTSTNSAASNSTTATSTAVSGGGSVQFDPQTLQALFAAQMSANGASSPSPWSQFGSAGAGQQSGSAWWQQSGQGDGGMMGGASGSGRLDGLLQTIAAADAGATSQSTSNANGSTTTTITYADGSSLSMTSAPTSSESGSSGNSATSSGGASVTGSITDTNNANGSNTTTITYADGSSVSITSPSASDSANSSSGAATSGGGTSGQGSGSFDPTDGSQGAGRHERRLLDMLAVADPARPAKRRATPTVRPRPPSPMPTAQALR
jgi:hypothetical protein